MKKKNVAPKKIPVEWDSENGFADLGLPHPEERLAKSMLASIAALITSMGLAQAAAAKRIGIDQPKISALFNARLRGFSTDRLLRFFNALGKDVTITIEPARIRDHGQARVLAVA